MAARSDGRQVRGESPIFHNALHVRCQVRSALCSFYDVPPFGRQVRGESCSNHDARRVGGGGKCCVVQSPRRATCLASSQSLLRDLDVLRIVALLPKCHTFFDQVPQSWS